MSDVKKLLKKSLSEKKLRDRAPQLKIKTIVKKVRDDLKPLEDLVQCGICLEKLTDPRMLTCQHTFCLACLKTSFTARNLAVKQSGEVGLSTDVKTVVKCPLCQKGMDLEKGYESLEALPKNLYLESLLRLLENDPSPVSPNPMDYRCVRCHTVSDQQEHVCQHCMQIFCSICWNGHILELDANLRQLARQIDEAGDRLRHKSENFSSRCGQLKETIADEVVRKTSRLRLLERRTVAEVEAIEAEARARREAIVGRIEALKERTEADVANGHGGRSKVTTYLNLHRETANLFKEIYHYGEARLIFDSDKFRIEQATEGIYNDVEEPSESATRNPAGGAGHIENPFESPTSMTRHYRSRSFVPKLVWTKCPRPGGVALAPWDPSRIYIAATDSHSVLVLDRNRFKLVGRITHQEMLCPTGIAFSSSTKEIFVTDRWKHCVHVFDDEGRYLRNGCAAKLKGPTDCAMGPNEELIVCDTGNNRILTVDPRTSEVVSTFGTGQVSMPSSVAVHGNAIVVADTDNNRVKVFDAKGALVREIGSYGEGKGQFKSPEVVAMDCLGFIFVGDAGNARIQVFQQDGTFVKIFGSKEGFGWISGICITPELDIVTTDRKNKNLRIF